MRRSAHERSPIESATARMLALPGVAGYTPQEYGTAIDAEERRLGRYAVSLLEAEAPLILGAGPLSAAILAVLPLGTSVVVGDDDDSSPLPLSGRGAVAIVSASAVDDDGLYASTALVASRRADVLEHAGRVILIVHASRLNHVERDAHRFGSLDRVDIAVTSGPVDRDRLRLLSGADELHVVDMPTRGPWADRSDRSDRHD